MRLLLLNYLYSTSNDLIALRKRKRNYTQHPISNFISNSFIILFTSIYFFFWLMLGFQKCIRSTAYSRLNSGDAGEDDGLRAEWDLGSWSHFHQGRKLLVWVGLHCQVKSWWVSGSLKSEIDCQKILTCVWAELCGYLLPGSEDFFAGPCIISSNIPLATVLVGHQECLPQW